MANNVTSTVYVKGTKELIDKVDEMFSHEKGGDKFSSNTEWLAKTVYEEYDWSTTPIGAKWCYLEQDEREDDNTYLFTTVSAWDAPIQYLEKLTEVVVGLDESAVVECTYIDEAPNFIGAFYGSKNGTYTLQEEPDDRPDEYDYEDEEGDIDYVAYDEAVDNYYYELDDLTNEMLAEARVEVDGDILTESEE